MKKKAHIHSKKQKKSPKKVSKLAKQKITKKRTKDERIPTGIPNFDHLIEKGFEKNSTTLLVGNSGSGKSIFSTQFLVEGMKSGDKALYVTFEEKKDIFFKNMLRFGWNLEEYERKGLFTFLEYTPEKVKTMLEEGGGAIENIIIKNNIGRLVIDSITSFALLFDNELERREAALSLFKMITKWNCTALLTYESDPMKEDANDHRTIEFECDAVVVLYYLRNKGERERYLEVLKMRGTHHSNNLYGFKIDNAGKHRGISVNKKAYRGNVLSDV